MKLDLIRSRLVWGCAGPGSVQSVWLFLEPLPLRGDVAAQDAVFIFIRQAHTYAHPDVHAIGSRTGYKCFFVWTSWFLVQSAAEHVRDPFTAGPAHINTCSVAM